MGCASSKQPRLPRCEHCGNRSSLARSNSVPVQIADPISIPIAIPQQSQAKCKGSSNNVAAFSSSTIGSFNFDSTIRHRVHDHIFNNVGLALQEENDDYSFNKENEKISNSETPDNSKDKEKFSQELRLAKTWSDMIDQKIPKVAPKTPIRTPPGEPETINAWELMEDLEDNGPLPHPKFRNPADDNNGDETPKLALENGDEAPIPVWLQTSDSNAKPLLSVFDPEIIATFRKALEDISPTNTSLLRSPEPEKLASPINNRWLSILSSKTEAATESKDSIGLKCPPGGEDKVVIYYTSLRGVRKTYEDCCQVRMIFKGMDVRVDERDVSMHYLFREELKELLGDGFRGGLPRVFVKERYIGGIEEIKQLHEDGSLEKLVQDCRRMDGCGGDGGVGGVCEACGDVRFVPCERCSGSCKIYYEGGDEAEEEEEEEEAEEDGYGFIRCPDCNENGIIRCPICC